MVKRLVKSTDKKLFGVAGGVAEYFDLDPTLVRIGFVVLCICFAFLGLVAYLALAIVMPSPVPANQGPSEGTPSHELAPSGEITRELRGAQESRNGLNLLAWVMAGLGVLVLIATFNFFSWTNWGLILAGAGVLLLAFRSRAR